MISNTDNCQSYEEIKSGRELACFENRKLSLKEFDKRGRFGTVKNSISSTIVGNVNADQRAVVTVLDDNISNGAQSIETQGQVNDPSKSSIKHKTADEQQPPMHPRIQLLDPRNLKRKADIKLLEQYHKQ